MFFCRLLYPLPLVVQQAFGGKGVPLSDKVCCDATRTYRFPEKGSKRFLCGGCRNPFGVFSVTFGHLQRRRSGAFKGPGRVCSHGPRLSKRIGQHVCLSRATNHFVHGSAGQQSHTRYGANSRSGRNWGGSNRQHRPLLSASNRNWVDRRDDGIPRITHVHFGYRKNRSLDLPVLAGLIDPIKRGLCHV